MTRLHGPMLFPYYQVVLVPLFMPKVSLISTPSGILVSPPNNFLCPSLVLFSSPSFSYVHLYSIFSSFPPSCASLFPGVSPIHLFQSLCSFVFSRHSLPHYPLSPSPLLPRCQSCVSSPRLASSLSLVFLIFFLPPCPSLTPSCHPHCSLGGLNVPQTSLALVLV